MMQQSYPKLQLEELDAHGGEPSLSAQLQSHGGEQSPLPLW